MQVVVNGQAREIADDATVASVVPSVTEAPSGVAVAVNGDLVTRSQWSATSLHEADQLEVLTATQGG